MISHQAELGPITRSLVINHLHLGPFITKCYHTVCLCM